MLVSFGLRRRYRFRKRHIAALHLFEPGDGFGGEATTEGAHSLELELGEIEVGFMNSLALGRDEVHMDEIVRFALDEEVDLPLLVLDEPVLAVLDEGPDVDLLAVGHAVPVAVDDGELPALLGIQDSGPHDLAGDEDLLFGADHAVGAVPRDEQDPVVLGDRELEAVALDCGAEETGLGLVGQLQILPRDGADVDGLEVRDLGPPRPAFAVLGEDLLDPFDGGLGELTELGPDPLDGLDGLLDIAAVLVDVVLRNPANRDLEQPVDIVVGDFPLEFG